MQRSGGNGSQRVTLSGVVHADTRTKEEIYRTLTDKMFREQSTCGKVMSTPLLDRTNNRQFRGRLLRAALPPHLEEPMGQGYKQWGARTGQRCCGALGTAGACCESQ